MDSVDAIRRTIFLKLPLPLANKTSVMHNRWPEAHFPTFPAFRPKAVHAEHAQNPLGSAQVAIAAPYFYKKPFS